ncbi:PulJ/GspJ family protein [Novipirellula artificiosorum]|nr:prepilin-type N-terminal cleavage/methylation domain-containing protein [Novipirellula artificiosorum]
MKQLNNQKPQRGFTLVEMLVSMAVTLLMMAALARAFAFVGERVRDSRADVEMTNELRDITTRLKDELEQCTVTMEPARGGTDPLGYFMYYEGPLTDATSSLFRVFTDAAGDTVLNDAKYGDLDDVLAFTAVAKPGTWFSGKVPRFVLDQKTVELLPVNNDSDTSNNILYNPANFPGSAWDPVVIRSKYAEIVYYASPEYAPVSLPASPVYIDVDGDTDLGSGSASENGYPDRVKLHRRVLLIRPDLNMSNGTIQSRSFNPGDGNLAYMLADAWPTASSATITSSAVAADAWMYGMAAVHQQCDLSLRRVLDSDGLPTQVVAANSIQDLAYPHNRFGHIRVPSALIHGSGGSSPTSMPVLALGTPPTVLNMLAANGDRIAPPLAVAGASVVTPTALSGFLRPEFVLGYDLSHRDSLNDKWGLQRLGEDVLTNNTLGFDLKIYDPQVSLFTTTNGLVLGPNDAGYREAMQEAVLSLQAQSPSGLTSVDAVVTRVQGDFVDLCYPVLAGGSLRGWQARPVDRRSTSADIAVAWDTRYFDSDFLVTPFSGVRYQTAGALPNTAYTDCLYSSGKLVTTTSGTGGHSIRLFQPTFDTFSSVYEHDGFMEGNWNGRGARWSTTTPATSPSVDAGANGLDDDGRFGVDDVGEKEVCAPFVEKPEAIRVTIRLETPETRQIRQTSVTHSGQ